MSSVQEMNPLRPLHGGLRDFYDQNKLTNAPQSDEQPVNQRVIDVASSETAVVSTAEDAQGAHQAAQFEGTNIRAATGRRTGFVPVIAEEVPARSKITQSQFVQSVGAGALAVLGGVLLGLVALLTIWMFR